MTGIHSKANGRGTGIEQQTIGFVTYTLGAHAGVLAHADGTPLLAIYVAEPAPDVREAA